MFLERVHISPEPRKTRRFLVCENYLFNWLQIRGAKCGFKKSCKKHTNGV